jgi:hypothetical protein
MDVGVAHADLTGFAALTAPTPRGTVGGAFGRSNDWGGFELELAHTYLDSSTGAPTVVTYGVSFFKRFKSPSPRVTFYGLVGFGVYCETGGRANSGLGGNKNLGGGAHLRVAGPLKLRLDYRWFRLGTPDGGEPVSRNLQRLSAGLSVAF